MLTTGFTQETTASGVFEVFVIVPPDLRFQTGGNRLPLTEPGHAEPELSPVGAEASFAGQERHSFELPAPAFESPRVSLQDGFSRHAGRQGDELFEAVADPLPI